MKFFLFFYNELIFIGIFMIELRDESESESSARRFLYGLAQNSMHMRCTVQQQ